MNRPHAPALAADIDLALETFARGFTFTRSLTFPYRCQRLGPAWRLHDDPRKNPKNYRVEEFVAAGIAPEDLDRLARAHARGPCCLCHLVMPGEDDVPLRAAYRALRYRLRTTEPLMIHRQTKIPNLPSPVAIVRANNLKIADALKRASGRRQIRPEHFADDSPLNLYVGMDGDNAVGWVTSIRAGDSAWVANMYVLPAYRRRGIAKALLAHMLADDRTRNLHRSILLASHTGALLYPVVGYEQLGTLFVYTPPRR